MKALRVPMLGKLKVLVTEELNPYEVIKKQKGEYYYLLINYY